jgi:hypothetical protein
MVSISENNLPAHLSSNLAIFTGMSSVIIMFSCFYHKFCFFPYIYQIFYDMVASSE